MAKANLKANPSPDRNETRFRAEVERASRIHDTDIAILLRRIKVLEDQTGVVAYTGIITDDAGNGTVEGDCNATDFTGQNYAVGTALELLINGSITFGHKDVAYSWIGPQDTTVGLGGALTALSSHFAPLGTGDHAILNNRDLADQHPQSAITGLVADQNTQDGRLNTQDGRLDNLDTEQVVQDGRLAGIDADQITQNSRLDGIDAGQATQDGRLDGHDTSITALQQWDLDHVNQAVKSDPHLQYALESTVASLFTPALLFGMRYSDNDPMNDIGITWQPIDGFDELSFDTPIGFNWSLGSGTFEFLNTGDYIVSLSGALTHNESNGSRHLFFRFFNVTKGVPSGFEFRSDTGRNTEGTPVKESFGVTIAATEVGDSFRAEIGGTADSYSSVVMETCSLTIMNAGLWAGTL